MDIRNDTLFEEGLAIGLGPDRQPCLAVVVKGTFTIPRAPDGTVEVADEQRPILAAEEYHDGDVTGSLRFDTDAVPYKPRADVVLVGRAYAPGGRPTEQVDVLLQVGRTKKAMRVFGDRRWLFPSRAVMIPVMSEPESFTEMPIRYERAFGGFDRKGGKWCDKNYIGKGFLGKKTRKEVDGKPLPNIEDPTCLITSWNDEPPPAGYGFYSSFCQPRAGYGGTEQGLEHPHPVFGLAADFSHDYYNGAHPDLQVPGYLQGDEEVELINLTRDGHRRFYLPGIRLAVLVHTLVEGSAEDAGEETAADHLEEQTTQAHPLEPMLDTLVFVPDEDVFYQVWRCFFPLETMEADLGKIDAVHIQMAEG